MFRDCKEGMTYEGGIAWVDGNVAIQSVGQIDDPFGHHDEYRRYKKWIFYVSTICQLKHVRLSYG